MSYLAPSLLITGLFVSSIAMAMPLQNTLPTTSKAAQETSIQTKTTPGSSAKNTVLVRNTATKPEPVATTTVKKADDKKTIGRCWKRLMNMVREINHAHTSKSK